MYHDASYNMNYFVSSHMNRSIFIFHYFYYHKQIMLNDKGIIGTAVTPNSDDMPLCLHAIGSHASHHVKQRV